MAVRGAVILIVMGVAGCGKTTLGQALAKCLQLPFKEGDDLHPPANVAKMSGGQALDDHDRAPWLEAIGHWIDGWRRDGVSGVITCSALKKRYREVLSKNRPDVAFVYLNGAPALIERRMAGRLGHFMPPALLASQFAALEAPGRDERVIEVSAAMSLEDQLAALRKGLDR